MKEDKNTLRSRQFAKIVDLLSEGPIRGVVNGLKGVYYDGTPLQAATGALAFKNTSVQFLNGYPAQPIMKGFEAQEAEEAVGIKILQANPLTRAIINTDADRCRITVSTPALSNTDTSSGDIEGNEVEYRIECAPNLKPFQLIGNFKMEGKTMSRYQRAHVFKLPGFGPWQIRVTRLTPEHGTDRQEDLYWDAYTMIIDDRVNYTRSACVGTLIDAEQFAAIPKRAYLTDGLLVLIPKNYDPFKATYTGVWDGTFKTDWTNNPAWVFYDLVVNNRYGLGSFITSAMIDKWALYKVAQFCDQRVLNGRGGTERRFTCNVQIMDRQEAFDLLAQIAYIFRGFSYWAGGQLVAVADDPSDPVAQYTNANVIDGNFTYSGGDIRARHTMVATGWSDMALLGEPRFAIVEDDEQITRFGIQKLDDPGFGSTSESQSIRTGKWALYTEKFESETVTFSTGLETAWVRPGDIIRVSDLTVGGKRRGGRVAAGSTASIVIVDGDIGPGTPGGGSILSCVIGEGVVQTRGVVDQINQHTFEVSPPFSQAPKPDTVWVFNEPGDLEPTLWRTLTVRQTDIDLYEVSAVRHYPGKWALVERGIAFSQPDISDIEWRPPPARNLAVREYMVQTSPISVGVRAVFSWQSAAPVFDVYWRKVPGNFSVQRSDGQAIDLAVTEGQYEFRVVPISRLGVRGDMAAISVNIIGRFALPAPPKQFRINVIEGVAMFDWLPATELDVIIGGHFELRHSSRTSGATWNTAQTVIPSISGNATSAETGYLVGTWFLRTFDITGRASATWATIIALAPDDRYTQFYRICEQPDWLGRREHTEVRDPQRWLIIGYSGGLWDDQTEALQPGGMDAWPDVDLLPEDPDAPPRENSGSYYFEQSLDAGAPFTIRLSAEILAFPYAEPDEFIDSRLTDCDTWENWDDIEGDLDGQVTLLMRSTLDDPASATANWSDWRTFIAGEHYGRGFEFMVVLTAPPGQNIGVETLCVTGDFKSKYDEGADVPYPAQRTRVNFRIKFYLVPAVVVTVQEAEASDLHPDRHQDPRIF